MPIPHLLKLASGTIPTCKTETQKRMGIVPCASKTARLAEQSSDALNQLYQSGRSWPIYA